MSELQVQRDSEDRAVGTKPQLILYGSDAALLERLKPHSSELPYISYEAGYGPQVTTKARLDAFWVTLMGAVELFGATPPFPLHQARVLRTPAVQLDKGFPRYGVVGVAVSQNDPKTPEYNLRLVMSALLKAVKDFNSQGQDRILRIGILPDDLELKKLDPKAAFEIVNEVYETA
jgi:hypothetical protein